MIDLSKALFFDIETHRVINWNDRPKSFQTAFINHYYDPQSYNTPEDHYSEVAGLYAEMSQCICIVFGYETPTGFKTMPIYGKDEIEVLNKISKVLKAFESQGFYLAGYNSDTCDSPYLVKRYIIDKLEVPSILNRYGWKPWELDSLDVMKVWQCGDYKRTSLEMVSASLGINCKTDDLGGSTLYQYDIDEMPWDKLVHYCTEDVISTYEIMKHILKYYKI